MTAIAVTALALCFGGWFYIRWAEETERVDNLCELIMSVDLDHDAKAGS